MNKRKVREELKWTGEETNFTKSVKLLLSSLPFSPIQVPEGWMEGISAK
jgi:hypothetical protein